ncbi:uncharacterized protein MONOS_9480 [Monocercomonoides exilis]|uniref:uncharacterized protein n=1 Tax=Monocercomonoides exilis TaxID=2049356 RepID=UPI0035593F03|nr:hypothetical protein MONOS_9480 [Monocercomonoides exilis]|eukprot:MONOS_9480.1-p1 / transcript=MONOS_9480.1 / gene=MONOS_9480 / organism=Monocercomonoides_exilis_PA203 / gene_product=unspecified product / transcript_product=unspecified product / location=Mono_scaffold00393:22912-23282(-) / protein_length=102 / sequence_SO=supercontig / SO=protein_coding / is_pseudo=false
MGLELLVRNTCVVLQNEVSVLYETVIEVVQMTHKSVEMNLLNISAPESRKGGTVSADLGAENSVGDASLCMWGELGEHGGGDEAIGVQQERGAVGEEYVCA